MRTELAIILCFLCNASILHGIHIQPTEPAGSKPKPQKRKADAGPVRDPRCPREGDFHCDSEKTRSMVQRGGLIISGQGGSATRAAYQVIEAVGTHASDCLDSSTNDAWAVRDAHILDKHRFWMRREGTVAYQVRNVEEDRHQSERMCEMLMRLHRSTAKFSNKSWMVKEPWLRLMFPFVDLAIGAHNYKFVHVTRDVRYITSTHGDEYLYDAIRNMVKLADFLMDSGRSGGGSQLVHAPREWHGALFNAADLKATLNGTKSSKPAKEKARAESPPGDLPAGGVMDIAGYTKFAYMWGVVELELHQWWQAERPQQYFHLSEKMMTDPLQSTATARSLGSFLGNPGLSEAALKKMQSAYDRGMLFKEEAHAGMIRHVIQYPNMKVVREALKAFGYDD